MRTIGITSVRTVRVEYLICALSFTYKYCETGWHVDVCIAVGYILMQY